MEEKDKLGEFLAPIVKKLQLFLENEMKLPLLEKELKIDDVSYFEMKKNTAMIGTTGDIQVILTLGYEDEILERLVDAFLFGEKVDKEELPLVQESICCEIANIVIGNEIKNPYNDTLIAISPPVFNKEAKSFAKYKNSKILVAIIKTEFGDIQLAAVAPKELFSSSMNFKEL